MKFSIVSVVAFSLSSSVLAAPLVSSDRIKRDLVGSLAGIEEVIPSNELTSELSGVVGSATTLLPKRSVMTAITGSVGTLKTSVTSDVASLSECCRPFASGEC